MKQMRLVLVLLLALFGASVIGQSVHAEDKFPSKNIRWLIPSKPGGGYDIYARAVGDRMLKYLPGNVKMIYLNTPAGGGVEAMTKLYNAKPEGYTLGIVKIPGSIVSQLTLPLAKYDVKEFGYVGNITVDPYSLLVKKDSPVNSVKELVEKKNVKFATTGVGATSWVNSVILSSETGIEPKYVHFTSSADATLAIIRGDAEALMIPLFSAIGYAESGDIKILAAFAKKRVKWVPDIPTIGEVGYPELSNLSLGRVIAVPPKTPEEHIRVLEDAFWKAINDQEFISQLEKAKRPIIDPEKSEGARTMVMESMKIHQKYTKMLKESIK